MNKIEKKSMEMVLWYEKQIRKCDVVKNTSKNGCGYDIESTKDKTKRFIEVKGFYNIRYPKITLWKNLKKQLGNKIKNYYIYIVYDINKDPKLKILKPKIIQENLEKDYFFIIRSRFYKNIKDIKLRKK